MKTRYLGVLLAFVFAHLCGTAFAQTMYRCGSKYQDKPCDAGQKGKAIGTTGSSAPAATATPAASSAAADAFCAQKGQDSLKIVWSREGGATMQRLLDDIDAGPGAPAKKAEDKRFVQDVYRRPGSAPQVQAAVRTDCVAQKEKEDRAAALAALAAKAQLELNPASAAPPSATPASAGDPKAARAAQQEVAARDADEKKAACARMRTSMDTLVGEERRGGSAGTMDRLRQQRANLSDDMRRGGC